MRKMKKIGLALLIAGNMCILYGQEVGKPSLGKEEVLLSIPSRNDISNQDLYIGKSPVHIPIYTYKDSDFEIPISLDYVSTGFKPNSTIGHMGLGWEINYGGYISRQINGMPDEGPGSNGINPYWEYHKADVLGGKTIKEASLFDPQNGDLYNGIGSSRRPPIYFWKPNFSPNGYETTPDIFYFNFGRQHSGNFCLGPYDIHVFNSSQPQGEYKIEITRDAHSDIGYMIPRLTFVITTGDGYKYTFDTSDKWGGVGIGLRDQVDFSGYYLWRTNGSEWPLTKIEAPNGRKVVFEYLEHELTGSFQQTYATQEEWDPEFNRYSSSDRQHGVYLGYKNIQKRLFPIKKITIDEISINFKYEERSNMTVGLAEVPTPSKLKSIQINDDQKSTAVKLWTFNYSQSESEHIFILKDISILGDGKYSIDYYNENFVKYPAEYLYGNLRFPSMGSLGIDHWGYANLAEPDAQRVILPRETTENNEEIQNGGFINFDGALLGMLKKITYPTGGYTKYYYEGHKYAQKVTKDLSHDNMPYLKFVSEKPAGGVRIKRITDYSSDKDSTYRDFYYNFIENDDYTGKSTGILLHTPRYFRKVSDPIYVVNDGDLGLRDASFLRKDVSAYGSFLHTKDKTHIGYTEVTERFSDGSSWKYGFSDYKLLPDLQYNQIKKIYTIQYSNPSYADNFYANYDSRHTQRGKLISKECYNSNMDLTYSEKYIYNYNKPLAYVPSVELAFSYFYMQKTFIEDYPLDRVETKIYPENSPLNPIIETTTYTYNVLGQITGTDVVKSNGQVVSTKNQYVYELTRDLGEQDIYDRMYDKYVRKYPIKIQTSISDVGIIAGTANEFIEKGNGLICLSKIKEAEILTPLSVSNFNFDQYLKSEKSYTYDDMGNIIQVVDPQNASTVYIWGGINLLAEIKNASLEDVKSISGFGNIMKKLNFDNLSPTQVNFLYNIPNAQVAVYEHKPLIGIISSTDSRKVTTYYDYDAFGRLKETYIIENGAKKVIRANEYHYRKQ